jgi:signal peptidase II
MTPAPPGLPAMPPSTPAAPGAPPPPRRLQRILAYRLLLLLAAGVLGLDQATKAWIGARLPYPTYGPPGEIVVIPGFFNLVHVGNTGAAWSLFSGRSEFLAALAAVTLVAIFAWRHQLGLRRWPVQVSFGLLCGGIVGNLVDRLARGHVVDFLDFHFGRYTYPTFNVADSGICVGVVIYLLYSLREPAPPRPDGALPPADPR